MNNYEMKYAENIFVTMSGGCDCPYCGEYGSWTKLDKYNGEYSNIRYHGELSNTCKECGKIYLLDLGDELTY